jgi:ABC-type sugar transport system ATPase subunit
MHQMTLPNGAATPLIECQDLVVDFGLNRALNRVSLSVVAGEIVGLVGPNGAGKSTLGRVFVGEIPFGAYRGTLKVGGTEARFASSRAAHDAGVVLVHQEGAAVDQLSIGENVMLTIEPSRYGCVNWPSLHQQAALALKQLGLVTDTRQRLGDHGGVALVELVEVARSIVRGSSVFVFDESTAALGAEEIRTLLMRMYELAGKGAGIIFISHRIDEVLSICDRVVVLRDGQIVMDAPRACLDHSSIVRAMLGSTFDELCSAPASETHDGRENERIEREPTALELRDWRIPKSDVCRLDVGPINLAVHRGEIFGVFGPLGAGKTELLHSVYGLFGGSCSGECWISGQRFAPFGSPRTAIQKGLALVSAERQREGVVPQLSVLENLLLGHHRRDLLRKGILINHQVSRQLCEGLIEELRIHTIGPDQIIATLSGGNQQKVLLGRAMANSPNILLLDEPTRGVDVGARQDVYRWIRATAIRGAAVIVSSLEESELMELAHRILVLRDGRQLAILSRRDTSEHELITLAGGGHRVGA